jgi:uroporphyrinogen-III decarboxylase
MVTDDQGTSLTREQKRQQRFDWVLNPQASFVSAKAQKAYKERAQRLIDTYNLVEPDRVPVILNIGTMPAFMAGLDYRTVIYDREKTGEAWTTFNHDHAEDLDTYTSPAGLFQGKVYDLLDYKLYAWPGHGLPENAPAYQYVEGEYMRDDEYDALIKDPTGFMVRIYMPRVFGTFEPYRMFPVLTSIVELPALAFLPFAAPQTQAAHQALADMGKELAQWMQFALAMNRRGAELGFPMSFMGGIAKAPFDTLGDTLRGTKGIMMDMYRRPDKVLEAMEVIADMTIERVITGANMTKGLTAMFPLHKGADGWMNEKQFETFYWPSLKKVLDAVIEQGIQPVLFAEGSFNTRLESINEFPKGAVSWYFDKTDMARAKKILGGMCSIQGNVPSSMLIAGTPLEVKEYCRRLIEICAPGGGFFLSPGAVGVDQAKLENLKAMVQAAREYGVYKK